MLSGQDDAPARAVRLALCYRLARIRRNLEIGRSADMVVAFWNGKSLGPRHTFEAARKMDKPVVVVDV